MFPEQLTLLLALEQFRSARTHFAFVVDEFGSVEGVVTLSDVMETIAATCLMKAKSWTRATIFCKRGRQLDSERPYAAGRSGDVYRAAAE